MKKLLKVEQKRTRNNKNFRFIIKKYASNYLSLYIVEAYRASLLAQKIYKYNDNICIWDFITWYRFLLTFQELKKQLPRFSKTFLKQETLKICFLSARARAIVSRFRLARTTFRRCVNNGLILGERKSSF